MQQYDWNTRPVPKARIQSESVQQIPYIWQFPDYKNPTPVSNTGLLPEAEWSSQSDRKHYRDSFVEFSFRYSIQSTRAGLTTGSSFQWSEWFKVILALKSTVQWQDRKM